MTRARDAADIPAELTATTAELNILDGVTATTAELNYVDGITSNIQTQLNGKATSAQGALADSAVQNLADLSITATATELNHLSGITANVQTQFSTAGEDTALALAIALG